MYRGQCIQQPRNSGWHLWEYKMKHRRETQATTQIQICPSYWMVIRLMRRSKIHLDQKYLYGNSGHDP